jgi:hypothetical protein
MDRHAQLQGWIEDTRRLQRKLAFACAGAGAIALALWLWNGHIGGIALMIVALFTACGFWVTAAHNAAHRQKIEELSRAAMEG